MKSVSMFALVLLASSDAFSQQKGYGQTVTKHTNTRLFFGVPTFGAGKKKEDDEKKKSVDEPKKQIGLSGLFQLITAGMGSPFLGDFEGVEEGTGKLMFSLEANNLVDENGKSKQTSMPYFESGWVDEEEEKRKKEKSGFKLW